MSGLSEDCGRRSSMGWRGAGNSPPSTFPPNRINSRSFSKAAWPCMPSAAAAGRNRQNVPERIALDDSWGTPELLKTSRMDEGSQADD